MEEDTYKQVAEFAAEAAEMISNIGDDIRNFTSFISDKSSSLPDIKLKKTFLAVICLNISPLHEALSQMTEFVEKQLKGVNKEFEKEFEKEKT